MDKNNEYTPQEAARKLMKSLYKMVSKALNNSNGNKYKEKAQAVVEDILDPNSIAQIKPESVPDVKDGVLWKGKDKGVDRLKRFKKVKKGKSNTPKSKK